MASLILLAGPSACAQGMTILSVDSPSAHFSPGNWVGDAGRGGGGYRQSWYNGAYCTWTWSAAETAPTATLLISNRTPGSAISYFIDGALVDNVAVPTDDAGIRITGISGAGMHVLTLYLRNSPQEGRWNESNACKITGLSVDADAKPGPAAPFRPWALIVGDSITEGIQADNGQDDHLSDYSFLVGQALRKEGYDYSLFACGYSGWLRPGDETQDVPPYYSISGSIDGTGGNYHAADSRWNKIDSTTSLLDPLGRISAYGAAHQEPAAILINYGTNETINGSSLSDVQASVTQCLSALRGAAPNAWLCVIMPFGIQNRAIYPGGDQYAHVIRAGVAAYRARHPSDLRVTLVDLGKPVANALASPPYGAGVHPNAAGHAFLSSQLLPVLLAHLPAVGQTP